LSDDADACRGIRRLTDRPLTALLLVMRVGQALPLQLEQVPQGNTEAQVFRALQGHKTVAGGNAPGMAKVRSLTLKGSYCPELRDAGPARRHPDSTLSGSNLVGGAFSGGVAPGYYIDPLRGSKMDSAQLYHSGEPAFPKRAMIDDPGARGDT
jgi:hypothetical protein